MIELAMEIPTSKVEEWSSLTSLDFVIGTAVLRDKDYAEFLARRPLNRELIMDNGYHEEGVSLSLEDLLEAAHRCRANYVISPDVVGDPSFTLDQFRRTHPVLHTHGYKTAVVWQGSENSSAAQRDDFLYLVREAEMLCCTFKVRDRLLWFRQSNLARRWYRIHLLGVSTLRELKEWSEMSTLDVRKYSVDTGKCIKWALQGKYLDQLSSLRTSEKTTNEGKPSEISQKILSLRKEDITPEVELVFHRNVEILKEACGYRETVS